jgi:hypothetical protein
MAIRIRIAALGIAAVFLWSASASAGQSAAMAGYGMGALLVIAIAGPLAGNADPDGDYDRAGLYVGGEATLAFNTFESEVEDEFGDVGLDESWGAKSRLGYRIHPRVSGEVEFEWLSGFDITANKETLADIEGWTITGNAKGYLLTGAFQPFALVGLGAMRAELDPVGKETDLAARFGGGLDFYACEHFVMSVNADYVYPTGDVKDLDYISVGVGFQYRF